MLLDLMQRNNQAQAGLGGAEIILNLAQCVLGIIGLVLLILMITTWKNALEACSERNREMSPGQAWLNLIPCFNFIWIILTVIKVSNSLQKEYKDRGIRGDGDYAKSAGITYFLTLLFCGPIGWIFLLIYRGKLNGYIADLEGGGRRRSKRRRDEDADDEEDERPRRRKSRDRDEQDDEDEDDDEDDRPRRRGR